MRFGTETEHCPAAEAEANCAETLILSSQSKSASDNLRCSNRFAIPLPESRKVDLAMSGLVSEDLWGQNLAAKAELRIS